FDCRMPMIAAMHEDDSPGLSEVARILAEILEIEDVGLDIRKLIVKTCDVVTRRAARLAAAGIVGILKKMGRDGSGGKDEEMKRTVVGVEGSLYTRYTSFREYLNEAVEQILGHEVASHVVINVVEDGAGIGPALLAAAAASSSS
ncbi:hexokinase 6, partial [Genlisea aurea]